MFSNSTTHQQPPTFVNRKLNKYKSTEDIAVQGEVTSKKISNNCQTIEDEISKPLAMKKTFNSLLDVSSGLNEKSSMRDVNKTSSTLDLTSSSYPYEICDYPTPLQPEHSTLPRKLDIGKRAALNKGTDQKPTLARAVSFNGPPKIHTRSQSLVDVGSKSHLPLNRASIEDARRSSLNALIEQRRKSMSKLRGLVIPEKVAEIPSSQCAIDLPEIKSKDCVISNTNFNDDKLATNNNEKNNSTSSFNKPSVTTSNLWKTDNQVYELPKYSPAFKRKSLSIYGAPSSVSSSLSSSREELRTCFNDNSKPTGPPATLPRSINTPKVTAPAYSPQPFAEPKSLESITSPSMSDASFEFISNPNSPNFKTSGETIAKYSSYQESPALGPKSNPDVRVTEEESDNDSAVSSSRSSISHGFSPPISPMPEVQRLDRGNILLSRSNSSSSGGRTLKRTLSSETTASTSSNGSTLTSGSQASCSSLCSSLSAESRRVLKPQSVEAINRKNVLSSARYSSGQDLKIGSPPMHIVKQEAAVIRNDKNELLSNTPESEKETIDNDPLVDDDCNEYKDITVSPDDNGNGVTNNVLTDRAAEQRVTDLENESSDEDQKDNHIVSLESGSSDYNVENEIVYDKCKYIDETDCTSPEIKEKLFDTTTEVESNSGNWKINCVNSDISLEKSPMKNGTASQSEFKNSLPVKGANTNKSVCVNDIKKAFEKAEIVLAASGRLRNNVSNGNVSVYHPRVSSIDSTNSDDSFVPTPTHYGSSSDLQKEQQFGSITSLASSTSLISQQELSQLIEESNHALEEGGCTQEVEVVILYRDTAGGSVGIILAGGADCEAKEITVHKVLNGSPAERDGRIQKGDRILSINGKSMKGLTHHESLAILKAPRPEVVLVVSRYRSDIAEDSPPIATIRTSSRHPRIPEHKINITTPEKGNETQWGPIATVHLIKDGTGLGFSLEGGKDSPSGDLPLTIKKIFTGGCAEKCGQLFAGDELLSVNSTDLSGLSRIEAWALMKKLPDGKVLLNIRHPL